MKAIIIWATIMLGGLMNLLTEIEIRRKHRLIFIFIGSFLIFIAGYLTGIYTK